MKCKLTKSRDFLLIRGKSSYILVGKACEPISLCIEAPDGELCQGLLKDDIIAVSAPEGGPVEPAIMLLELVRRYRCPLIVLPKDHPGSGRLKYIVSAGEIIRLELLLSGGGRIRNRTFFVPAMNSPEQVFVRPLTG